MVSLRRLRHLRQDRADRDQMVVQDEPQSRPMRPNRRTSGDYHVSAEARAQRRKAAEDERREYDDYIDALIWEASLFCYECDDLRLRIAFGTETPEEVRAVFERYEGIKDKTYAASYAGEALACCAAHRVGPVTRERLPQPE